MSRDCHVVDLVFRGVGRHLGIKKNRKHSLKWLFPVDRAKVKEIQNAASTNMGESYIRLTDFRPDQSHQNPDDSVYLQNPSPTNGTNKADRFKFNVLFCVRFLVTAMVIASIIGTLKSYEKKGNFSPHQKTTFNVIITGEGLCLGLNFFVSS